METDKLRTRDLGFAAFLAALGQRMVDVEHRSGVCYWTFEGPQALYEAYVMGHEVNAFRLYAEVQRMKRIACAGR